METCSFLTLGDGAATAFDQVPAALNIAVQNAAGGIGQKDLCLSLGLFFQVPGNTSQSTASAGRTSESVYLAIQLLPDLGTRRLDVSTTVGSVIELISPHCVLQSLSVTGSLVVVVLRVVEGNGWHGVNLGAYFVWARFLIVGKQCNISNKVRRA